MANNNIMVLLIIEIIIINHECKINKFGIIINIMEIMDIQFNTIEIEWIQLINIDKTIENQNISKILKTRLHKTLVKSKTTYKEIIKHIKNMKVE
jgi:hypothetical protein